jgi:nucleoside-diphosphate-sugar epimerase
VLPFFKSAEWGVLPLLGRADAAYTFVHVRDVVRAIVAAIERPVEGVTMFVGHPRPVTPRDILEAVRMAVGRRAVIVRVPLSLTRLAAWGGAAAGRMAGRPMPLNRWRYVELAAEGFVCRVDRLREQLGIVAEFELREGFAHTAAWYRQAGWLRK